MADVLRERLRSARAARQAAERRLDDLRLDDPSFDGGALKAWMAASTAHREARAATDAARAKLEEALWGTDGRREAQEVVEVCLEAEMVANVAEARANVALHTGDLQRVQRQLEVAIATQQAVMARRAELQAEAEAYRAWRGRRG